MGSVHDTSISQSTSTNGSSMQHAERDTSHMGGHTFRDTYYPLTGAARHLFIHLGDVHD